MAIIRKIKKNIINIPGWRTDRKIIVIESDDWGSIRTSSKKAYENLKSIGYKVEDCHYNRYDTLESNDDMEALLNTLGSLKTREDNKPIITLNNIVANPDFEKIRKDYFTKYYYEPFTETLTKYPNHQNVSQLYKDGIKEGVFKVQFHGREHINVSNWMKRLRTRDKSTMDAFENKMFTLHATGQSSCSNENLDYLGDNSNDNTKKSILIGLKMYRDIWNDRSLTFIAPCYIWSKEIEEVLSKNGIKYLQGTHMQKLPPKKVNNKFKKKYHYLGEKNEFDQTYLVRNVFFEPSENTSTNWVAKAFLEVKNAFFWNKPAIICTHRVNFIGGIDESNRLNNLRLFRNLLNQIIKEYPEVEFLSSDELGVIIEKDKYDKNSSL